MVKQDSVYRPKEMLVGEAEIILRLSDYDPWVEVEVVKMLGALYTVGGALLNVTIEPTGKSGDGVAMVEGFAIIVRGSRERDSLRVKIDAVKPNFAFAEILERKD